MNPVFIFFLFAMSLIAIAAACALLVFIANQLKLARKAEHQEKDGKATITDLNDKQFPSQETEQVSDFLSKMKAATLIGVSRPQKRIDDQDVN